MQSVLFILRNHFINDSRVLKEAQTLSNNGYSVTIRCLWDTDLPKFEDNEKFKVERVCYSDRKKTKSFLKKIATFLKYIKSTLKDLKKFDIVHCHDLDGLVVGSVAKILSFGKLKLVYDAHEYEVEIGTYDGVLKKIIFLTEATLIKLADDVICVSDSIANEYKKNYNIKKPNLVLNCPPINLDETNYDYFRKKFKLDSDVIVFLYQGGLSQYRGLDIILNAFIRVSDPNKVIIFMGYGQFYNKIKKASKEHDNIYIHEAVSPTELLKYTSSADMGILFYENTCLNHYYCSPNKFFEYTQAGLPIIVSDLFEMRRIVNKYKNGVNVPESVDSLVKTIKKLTIRDINNYLENIPEMKKVYNWSEQEKVLLNIYKNIN